MGTKFVLTKATIGYKKMGQLQLKTGGLRFDRFSIFWILQHQVRLLFGATFKALKQDNICFVMLVYKIYKGFLTIDQFEQLWFKFIYFSGSTLSLETKFPN